MFVDYHLRERRHIAVSLSFYTAHRNQWYSNIFVRYEVFTAVTMKSRLLVYKNSVRTSTVDTLRLPYRVQPVNAM
jgi:hypothetical protein